MKKIILFAISIVAFAGFALASDGLREGVFYKISVLNGNTTKGYRVFKTKGYVSDIPKCPAGGDNTDCIHYAIISEIYDNQRSVNNLPRTNAALKLTTTIRESLPQVGKYYDFIVKVGYNDLPKPAWNDFILVSFKEVDQGNFYSISKLQQLRATSSTPVKTEGYVSKIQYCGNTNTICYPLVSIVENKTDASDKGINFGVDYDHDKDLKVNQQYEFSLRFVTDMGYNKYYRINNFVGIQVIFIVSHVCNKAQTKLVLLIDFQIFVVIIINPEIYTLI